MSRLSRFLPKFLRGDKAKASNSAKAGDKSNCKIIFLDETEYYLPYKGGLKGQYVLEKVYEQLNLFEKDYFGLRFIDQSGQTHWLDVNKNLSSQFKACTLPYTLYFGVKFYPADPCKLKEEITRYQFFLQVKRDILHGRLPVTFEEASELFAYAVQSELGDFDSQQLPQDYVSEFQFVPNQTEQLEENISMLHRRLGGTVPATAELKYLDKVKWLDMYGVDLHPVMGDGNTEYFLGLTPTGIVVYKNKTKVGNYFWPRVTKVNYKAKVFIVKVRDKINDEHTYAFELMTKAACKHLWKCCVEHHAFFRLCQLGDAASRTSKPYRSTAKHRNSGRHDRQNGGANQNREQPHVIRVQSRRQARRAMSDTRLNQADMMTTGIQYSEGHVTMVVTPEHVKGPRHRSLPDLKGRESPTSTKSAPWETNMDTGLYTSGRESPVSVTQSENVNHYRRHRESDSDAGYRKKHHHNYGNHSQMAYPQHSSRRSGYDSEPQSSSHRRKYFPSSRKGSDNESDASFTRRRRKELDSGSESDVSPKYTARQRKAKSMGPDNFENEWNMAVEGMYLPGKDNKLNGSAPMVHSAPGGEARQKKMRRKRSKSPGNKHPPEELRQYIEFDLVDPADEEKLRDIPYVNVETKAEPFKIRYSPKTRHRYRSPKRKAFNELEVINRGGYISDDGPPKYKTPERTPEPTHKQIPKTGGYYSDAGSRPGSLPRNQNGPVNSVLLSTQPNNVNSPAKQSKPIENYDDRIPPIDNVNSNSVKPRQFASGYGVSDAPDLNLDLRGNFGEVEVHEPEDDRNRDSGLNSSQGSSSTPLNTTPRTASRLYGTQDAIARLYSSPAGTRRTPNNSSVNQSPSSANRNSGYKQYASTNQTLNQASATSAIPNVPHSRQSNVSSVQNSTYSRPNDTSYGKPFQNGFNADQFHQPTNDSYSQQSNFAHRGRQPSKQNGFASTSSDMFYTQSNSSSNYVTPSGQEYRSPSNQNNNKHYGSPNYSNNKQRFNNQDGSRNMFPQSDLSQQYSQNHSSYGDRLDSQKNWKYVGNGDGGTGISSYGTSGYSQQGSRPAINGNQSPYKQSPTSPVKQGSRPHVNSTASPKTQSRNNVSVNMNRTNNVMSPASQSIRSPDSAISSLPSSSNIDGYHAPSGTSTNHFSSRSPSSSPQKYNTETNFARARTPAFGRSDIWTEI